MAADHATLERAVGYNFVRRELLVRALTHSSYVSESGLARHPDSDNEQLEFLGDSVLGFVVAEYLVLRCPGFDEGRLSSVRAKLVSRSHLRQCAQAIQLGDYLAMGRGEEMSGGRTKEKLIVNAFEALLGAVYLDSGLSAVQELVLRLVIGEPNFEHLSETVVDLRAMADEAARERGLATPTYTVRTEGPANALRYIAETQAGTSMTARGEASTKRAAIREAARELLHLLS